MRKYTKETTVGIFVFVGLLCVAYMTIKLGDINLFGGGTYPLYARFTSVSGLRVGSPIEMVGLRVGKIAAFHIDQEKQMAVVEMQIEKKIVVYDDAIASVKTAGLIGDKYIQIDAGGGGDVLKPGGTIIDTQSAIDIGDLIGKYAFGSVDEKK